MQLNDRRYGDVIPWLISAVDLVLLNAIYYGVCRLMSADEVLCSRMAYLLLNLSYLVVIYFQSPTRNKRVVYADKNAIRTLKSVVIHAALFLVSFSFVTKGEFHWRPLGVFYLCLMLLLGIWSFAAQRILRHFRALGYNYRNVVLVGWNEVARKLVTELTEEKGYGYRVLGVFDEEAPEANVPGVNMLGGIDAMEEFIVQNKVDEVFCVTTDSRTNLVARVMRIADHTGCQFFYVPTLGESVVRQLTVTSSGKTPVLAIAPGPLSNPVNKAVKRAFDLAVSSVAMLLSPIVLIPVAIAVKLSSPGPIFFTQTRTGYKGREFKCYKFRSMRQNDDADSEQATKDDARKTAVGKFLRKSNIDELPQFYNVFKGDMSLVGPRPHMVAHTEMYSALIDKYMLRHTIKPGITGWAQVNGYRGQTDELWKMEKRVEYDVWYAEHWNFMLDLKIMLLTVVNMIRGEENAF